jgi:hypothetical protein
MQKNDPAQGGALQLSRDHYTHGRSVSVGLCLACQRGIERPRDKQRFRQPHPRRIKTMIDNKQIAKQMVEFNKTAFDNSFKAMTMVYEQNEKMLEAFLGQASWMPAEGRKALQDWMGSYKKGCQDFKKIVDDNYAKVEGFFSKGD